MLSPVATSLVVLLNNITDLCVKSQNRQMARDAMQALSVYAKHKAFRLPPDKVQNFYDVLLDSRPLTLAYLLRDLAADVVQIDASSRKSK
ncbi:MAG: hypothetical protein WC375_08665 [Methanomassiliicoccales archaeon]|jgi:hypothetical protein